MIVGNIPAGENRFAEGCLNAGLYLGSFCNRFITAPGRSIVLAVTLALLNAGCERTVDGPIGPSVGVPIIDDISTLRPCAPARDRGGVSETELRLDEQSRFPCRIVAVPLGVELRADPDGAYPDPQPRFGGVAMDQHGRIVTSTTEAKMLAWNSDGTLREVFGSQGQGPGELTRMAWSLSVDGMGNLHVADYGGRWLVFDPNLEFVRMWSIPISTPRAVHAINDTLLLFTHRIPGGELDSVLHVVNMVDGAVTSAGLPRPGRSEYLSVARPSLFVNDSSVWIAPGIGTGEGYVLEQRTIGGRLVRLIRRNTPWAPVSGSRDNPNLPQFDVLHMDQHGWLWVGGIIGEPQELEGHQRGIFEVIDPGSGQVLASTLIIPQPRDEFPRETAPTSPVRVGTNVTYRMRFEQSGLVTIQLFELHLVENVQ